MPRRSEEATGHDDALQLLKMVPVDPVTAMRRARELLEVSLEPDVRSVVLRAAGMAARAADSISESLDLLTRSVESARDAGDTTLQAEAELSLSGSIALSGDLPGALALLEQYRVIPEGLAARFAFQRATIMARSGRAIEAEGQFSAALERFRANEDVQFESQTLANRGRLRMEIGDLDGAELDLRAAYAAYQDLGHEALGAWVLHNLGDLAASRGDIVGALQHMDASQCALERLTETPWEAQVSLGDTLLSAGLIEEVVELTSRLDTLMSQSGLELERAEVLLLRSRALLLGGSLTEAKTAASNASEVFYTQDREVWAMKAELLKIRSADHSEESRALDLGSKAFDLAKKLDERGSTLAAIEARAEGVIRLADAGQVDLAIERLPSLRDAARAGHIERRLLYLYAEAFVHAAANDRRKALRAISSAVRLSERYRLSLGAMELALSGANHTALLLDLAKKLASGSADNRLLFRWSEYGRARTLLSKEVQPPTDDKTATAYSDVRRLAKQLDTSSESERGRQSVAYVVAARQLREAERQRQYHSTSAQPNPVVPLADVRSTLEDRRLVSLVSIEGRMLAQVVDRQRTVRLELGQANEWVQSFRLLRRRLDAVVHGVSGAKADAERLGQRLSSEFAPVASSTRELVLIPPAELFDAPWGALEQLADVPLSISPSASSWAQTHNSTDYPLEALTVAGPELSHANAEAQTVALAYKDPLVLTGKEATVERVLASLPTARTAHIACHGQHRQGNALFSSLSLHDGPLPALEIEKLTGAPKRIVLSSCMAAGAEAIGGSELLGLTSIFLRIGADSVLAGNGLVLDSEVTVGLMARYHEELQAGASPAKALLNARPRDPTNRLLTSSGFHVYGRSR